MIPKNIRILLLEDSRPDARLVRDTLTECAERFELEQVSINRWQADRQAQLPGQQQGQLPVEDAIESPLCPQQKSCAHGEDYDD